MVRIKPIRRQSLVDTVVERIQAVITDGRLGPGARLPTETALMKQFQVSRTVLREAVGRLEVMGLVAVRGSRGMFVGERTGLQSCLKLVRSALTVSPRELVLFTEFRRAIECDAVRIAAERASARDLAELETLCERVRDRDLSHLEAFQLDFRFHRHILELTGNELTCNVMEVVQEFVMASIREGGARRRDPEVTYHDHAAIVAAIKQHDPDAAEQAMRAHLDNVLSALREQERQDSQSSAG
jgi:GntR family transcriptional repressor for pyruvate dehydrogenase complex